MRILGLDPGLQRTGWGVVDAVGARLSPVAAGAIATDPGAATAVRLMQLHHGLAAVIAAHRPDAAAVEETFVNKNPVSTLKLGQARGVVLLAPALAGLPVVEYAPNLVKKSVVGAGHAGKEQVMAVVRMLLPALKDWDHVGADAADALAVAICHAHHAQTQARWAAAGA